MLRCPRCARVGALSAATHHSRTLPTPWAQHALFLDYRIESRAENNRISFFAKLDNLNRALKSCCSHETQRTQVKLTKKMGGAPTLTFEIQLSDSAVQARRPARPGRAADAQPCVCGGGGSQAAARRSPIARSAALGLGPQPSPDLVYTHTHTHIYIYIYIYIYVYIYRSIV